MVFILPQVPRDRVETDVHRRHPEIWLEEESEGAKEEVAAYRLWRMDRSHLEKGWVCG